jgi:pyridoxal phosphate enzyme (YggS family)
MNDISDNYQTILAEMSRCSKVKKTDITKSDRMLQLVAVSKEQPVDKIERLLEQGHRVFGENKVQEAYAKWPELRSCYADIELHLIGSLQSNKAREAVALFDVIETVDRPKIAHRLAEEMHKQHRPLPCYVQVNIGKEPQKSGVMPEDLDALLIYCKEVGLAIVGLMCVPPHDEPPEAYFAQMQKLTEHYGFEKLSMGMSGDYPKAIQYGATHIRVGTALFGARG